VHDHLCLPGHQLRHPRYLLVHLRRPAFPQAADHVGPHLRQLVVVPVIAYAGASSDDSPRLDYVGSADPGPRVSGRAAIPRLVGSSALWGAHLRNILSFHLFQPCGRPSSGPGPRTAHAWFAQARRVYSPTTRWAAGWSLSGFGNPRGFRQWCFIVGVSGSPSRGALLLFNRTQLRQLVQPDSRISSVIHNAYGATSRAQKLDTLHRNSASARWADDAARPARCSSLLWTNWGATLDGEIAARRLQAGLHRISWACG